MRTAFGTANELSLISPSIPPLQFRSLRNCRMLNIPMRKTPVATNKEDVAAAEFALKAHVLVSDPEILAEVTDGDALMQEILDTVNLTEAPEDAVCGLVIDLLQYCEREKIDWNEEVMSRAWERFLDGA